MDCAKKRVCTLSLYPGTHTFLTLACHWSRLIYPVSCEFGMKIKIVVDYFSFFYLRGIRRRSIYQNQFIKWLMNDLDLTEPLLLYLYKRILRQEMFSLSLTQLLAATDGVSWGRNRSFYLLKKRQKGNQHIAGTQLPTPKSLRPKAQSGDTDGLLNNERSMNYLDSQQWTNLVIIIQFAGADTV